MSSAIGTSKRLYGDDILEIVVVAANSFGSAHPARLTQIDGKWSVSYHI